MHLFVFTALMTLGEALLKAILPAGLLAGLLKLSGDWWKRRKDEKKHAVPTIR